MVEIWRGACERDITPDVQTFCLSGTTISQGRHFRLQVNFCFVHLIFNVFQQFLFLVFRFRRFIRCAVLKRSTRRSEKKAGSPPFRGQISCERVDFFFCIETDWKSNLLSNWPASTDTALFLFLFLIFFFLFIVKETYRQLST